MDYPVPGHQRPTEAELERMDEEFATALSLLLASCPRALYNGATINDTIAGYIVANARRGAYNPYIVLRADGKKVPTGFGGLDGVDLSGYLPQGIRVRDDLRPAAVQLIRDIYLRG